MKLSKEEVEHIAKLARLELSEEEIERYRSQLSDILDYADRLQALDTSNIPPTASVLKSGSNLRKDQSKSSLQPGDLKLNAPEFEENQFRVPPVME